MLLPYSLLPLLASLLAASIMRRYVHRRELLMKILSVSLLFVFFVGRLFRNDAIHSQLGLYSVSALMPAVDTVCALVARWLGLLTVAMGVLLPFFKKRELHDFMAFVAPISVILSSVFLKQSFISITGNPDPLYWRNAVFMLELLVIGIISFLELSEIISRRPLRGGVKRVFSQLGFILTYIVPFMPAWVPGVIFGAVGEKTTDFTVEHRLHMYLCIFVVFFFYITLRNKSYDERSFALITLATSAFFSYFSIDRSALSMLPLHLCNTAIVITLVTYVFKLKGMFYFTYLVNVLGAVFAIVMPNVYVTVSEPNSVLYWFDHIYAFALPLLGVALAVFPRPNFKMVTKAIAVFTVYFVTVAVLDGWFNNADFNTTGEVIDYFFLYSTFYLDKFPFALPLYKPWDVYVGGQLIRFFPMYQLLIYVVFIAAMFGLWGIYAALFKVADDHKLLAMKRKLMSDEHLRLIAEMGGRPKSAPLNPNGENMIKIEHFSKVYNGSSRKAADDINIEIRAGEVFGFIGHNGAGKSTTIKSLVGIQSITEGRIEVEGYDIARQPMEAKMNIGYVSDNHAVYEKLTGREYVNYVANLYRVPEAEREQRLDKYVKMFKLEEAIDREIKGYSHGMKQKIMVISALIHDPKVWVLDEPLTGLDPTSSYQIKQCMREHADRGNIVFFSSHIIEVVERICDRIAIIAGGKIRMCATMDEIRASGKSLEQIYLGYIKEEEEKNSSECEEKETEPSARAVC